MLLTSTLDCNVDCFGVRVEVAVGRSSCWSFNKGAADECVVMGSMEFKEKSRKRRRMEEPTSYCGVTTRQSFLTQPKNRYLVDVQKQPGPKLAS